MTLALVTLALVTVYYAYQVMLDFKINVINIYTHLLQLLLEFVVLLVHLASSLGIKLGPIYLKI